MKFDDLNLSDVELLIDVSAAGSIRKVAMRRNIAQPALSRRVRSLEECLGAPLFERHRKGVELTSFGNSCLRRLSEWRAEGLALSRKIAEDVGRPSTIRLGTYDSVGIYYFPRLLSQIKSSRLNCDVELHLDRSREIIRRVHEGRVDLGLVFCGGLEPKGLRIRHVATDEYGFYESPKSRMSEDFHTMQDAGDDEGCSVEQALKDFGLQHHRLVSSPSFEVALALTLGGLGIGVLPHRVAEASVRQRKLRRITMGKTSSFGRHCLSVVRAEHRRDESVDMIAQLIKDGFASE